jgi:predicted amidophosphoribosyltransferase
LAGLLACATRAAAILPAGTILVPVPASRASILRRGFNPAAEIARYVARRLDLDCRPGLLLRVQEGVKQTRRSRAERFIGTDDLYRCPRRVDGVTIAVVDDVLTTGSTLDSIARQFRSVGAVSVYGLVVARTPFHGRPEQRPE